MRANRWILTLIAGLGLPPLAACGDTELDASSEPAGGARASTDDADLDDDGDAPDETGDAPDETDAEPGEAAGDSDETDGALEDDDPTDDEPGPLQPLAPKPLRPFRVMTYNVRHPTSEDTGVYAWNKRRAAVVARILANKPDIVGVQEASSGADKDLIAGLTGGDKPYAVFRPSKSGSPKLVFYRKTRFAYDAATGKGNESLPNPYGKSHECYPNANGRRAAWVGLREKDSQAVFLVVNAHIAHGSKCSAGRKKQAEAIRAIVRSRGKGLSKVVMGDFNTDPQATATKGETTISILESAGLTRAASHSGTTTKSKATFNSDWKKKGWKSSARLDWIFHSGGAITSTAPAIDRATANGITPSDHFAVLATIRAAN